MQNQQVIETQLEFYRKGGAGCLFAAHAAGDPARYGWRLSVSKVDKEEIVRLVQQAISLDEVSTQSIIFPSIITTEDFRNFLLLLKDASPFFLEQEVKFRGMI